MNQLIFTKAKVSQKFYEISPSVGSSMNITRSILRTERHDIQARSSDKLG